MIESVAIYLLFSAIFYVTCLFLKVKDPIRAGIICLFWIVVFPAAILAACIKVRER